VSAAEEHQRLVNNSRHLFPSPIILMKAQPRIEERRV
jgi:hypothetical protein